MKPIPPHSTLFSHFFERVNQLTYQFRSPIGDVERHWNDNARASLAAVLVTVEMLVYGVWYFIGFYFDLIDSQLTSGVHKQLQKGWLECTVIVYMVMATITVGVFSAIMSRAFLKIKPKTKMWYIFQAIFITMYFSYCVVFAQLFGENTIINGLNLSGGVILGLLLLERYMMLLTFCMSIVTFTFISLNRKVHWFELGVFAESSSKNYWFWILTYLYFTLCKVVSTVFVVDWILKNLGRQQAKIHELSQRDTLTGIYNRRTIYCYLNFIWLDHFPCTSVSLIYFDLDKFKDINDQYGHGTGDQTLIETCQVVNQTLQMQAQRFRFGRLGGEEFVVVLPNLPPEQAITIAETLRQAIKSHAIMAKHQPQQFFVTASFGVATLIRPKSQAVMGVLNYFSFEDYLKNHLQVTPELPIALQDLINIASDATRRAKQLGRDKVVDGGCNMDLQSNNQPVYDSNLV